MGNSRCKRCRLHRASMGTPPEDYQPQQRKTRKPGQREAKIGPGNGVGKSSGDIQLHRAKGRKLLEDWLIANRVANGVLQERIEQAEHNYQEKPGQLVRYQYAQQQPKATIDQGCRPEAKPDQSQ